MKVGLPPREVFAAQKRFSQKTKYYRSQPARTWFKEFFELNWRTVLDTGHNTTELSADQMIQFAKAVALEAFHGYFNGLIVARPWVWQLGFS